jgi:hypothetical protein
MRLWRAKLQERHGEPCDYACLHARARLSFPATLPTMKIVIAPDSFKESLSALEVASEIEAGFRHIYPHADYCKLPMADGGEGTVQALDRCQRRPAHRARWPARWASR